MQPVEGDALGSALLAALDGRAPSVVIERDDGFVDVDGTDYFGGLTEPERHALASATGRVLDVGAGAGRGALVMQERGQRVTALDVSAGAVEACRRRGVRNVYHGTLAQAAGDGLAGVFDSAVLLGSNVGLLGSRENAPAFLADLARLVKPDGVVAGVILDPYGTSSQVHLAYHDRNRERGRLPGQLTMRVRYQNLATGWFDWLCASRGELTAIAAAAGWEASFAGRGSTYTVILTRQEITNG
jgi:SAM-dependent methyltransferase